MSNFTGTTRVYLPDGVTHVDLPQGTELYSVRRPYGETLTFIVERIKPVWN